MIVDRTYKVEVEGVGDFTFRRRVLRDQLKIEAIALRILGGPTEDEGLRQAALALATLEVLTVDAPEGWQPGDVDPLDEASVDAVFKVRGRLLDREATFRQGSAKDGSDSGASA